MAARFADAEALATANLELGMKHRGARRVHDASRVRCSSSAPSPAATASCSRSSSRPRRTTPASSRSSWRTEIICEAVGRDDVARETLHEGMAHGFAELPVDNFWTTSIIGYSVLAIQLEDAVGCGAVAAAHPAVRERCRVQRRHEPGADRRVRREARVASSAFTTLPKSISASRWRSRPRSVGSTTERPRCSRSRRLGTAASARSTPKGGRGSPRRPSGAAPVASRAGSRRSTRSRPARRVGKELVNVFRPLVCVDPPGVNFRWCFVRARCSARARA